MISPLEQAGCWFLHSGIQEPANAKLSGGVARYFRADTGQNAAVSNEITGYAASAFAYLYSLSGRRDYLDACVRAARYLSDQAWDASSATFPFEPGSPHVYFFDTGIIARGLMAAWRASGVELFATRARAAARSLSSDFQASAGGAHAAAFPPVIELPGKEALHYEPRWSRSPGCYQLKSAVAWIESDDPGLRQCFEAALEYALATHKSFLSDEPDRERLMDRLHAYCYFLEAMLFVSDRHESRCALEAGIGRVGALLREIAPEFERSDVCAQLLRVRLIAHHLDFVALDEDAASEEALRAAAYHVDASGDAADERLRGGFWFGRKRGEMLRFMNPVSTAFSTQALALWEQHRTGAWRFELNQLI